MPLTPSEQAELDALRTEFAPKPTTSGLSASERAELDSLRSELGGPTPGEQALEGMSKWERTTAGAGKALADTWHGTKQLGAEAVNLAANFSRPGMAANEDVARLRAEADETQARDEALLADPYGMAGNIGGHVALSAALPASRIPTAIGSAAAYGSTQPVGVRDSRIENATIGALWGGAGSGAAHVVGRAVNPVRNATAPGTQALINEAEQGGYRFSAGQATGNKHVQNAEGALETLPTGGSHLRDMDEHNQLLTNRTVGREMGEQVDAITPDVIEAARGRIGAVMDNPSNGRPLNVDKEFFDAIYGIRAKYDTALEQSGEIKAMLDKLAAGGKARHPQITGEQYKETVSALRTEAEAAFRSGSKVNDAGVKAKIAEALEGLAERNLTGDEIEAFLQARRQYSATLIAEKSVRTDGSGHIRIEALDGATKKHRRVAHRQGTEDELVRLARIGQHLKKVRIPDSGTAPRSWWLKAAQSPLTMGVGSAGVGYAAGGGDPLTAGAGLLMPLALSRGMYSQVGQNWLRHGLQFPGRDGVVNALTRLVPGAAAGTTQALR